MIEAMSAVARDVVSDQPSPPRSVRWRDLLRAAYGTEAARWVVGIGGTLGAVTLAVGIIASGEPVWKLLILAVGGTLFTMSVGAPAILAARTGRALRRGIQIPATVVEVRWTGPGEMSTIDALSSGLARGRRRVEHPTGSFTQAFETDATWARELRPGSSMLVLAEPSNPSVLFDLGPTEATDVPTLNGSSDD